MSAGVDRLTRVNALLKREIADYLELESARVIYDWTSGVKMPSLENFINLAIMFHVSIEDILVL